ncbi:MAG: GDSL-type esterase/lipase family protein [Flavobacteriales bacterium]|nr:MAG: GDSL-type esterase/lipase family protein [Flavobacteriales bacterium]
MTPTRILAFLVAVLLLLAAIGALLPAGGLQLAGLNIRLPGPREALFPAREERVDISDIIALEADTAAVDTIAVAALEAEPADTVAPPFAFDASKLAPLEERIRLHFPPEGPAILHPFFAALQGAASAKRPVRILHYGDSQLEGDRITAYVRNKLQVQFGGQGPGLVAVADIVPHFSVARELSAGWTRYSVMSKKPKEQGHDRFGALSAFARFTPILPDSVAPDSTERTATITLRPERRSYGKAQAWSVCRLFYGWHRAPLTLAMAADGAALSSETVEPEAGLLVREWRFESAPKEVTITMTGADSPDVFGISLEGRNGVAMDNIAARGAAGYEFRRTDQGLLTAMYAELAPRLLILQYGGNVLPNLKSKEEAEQYGRFFGAQIARFKRMIPGVCVIVIGPSDMSVKDGADYVTRPWLEEVRDAMKAHALAQGAAFWDMYEAMGGRNSMVSWVQADPPLAAEDYTHFSPQGARKVGELFYTALINEFAAYHKDLP